MPIFSPTDENLSYLSLVLRSGGLVAFPTETVYGLGANALDSVAVAKIYAAKGRPSNNPLIVHVESKAAAIEGVVSEWNETAETLAEWFWPGGLTLILPVRPEISPLVTGGGTTVGVRVPAHPLAQKLIEWAGVPIAAPSANRSLSVSPTTAQHVALSLGENAPVILDGGATSGGIESTVLLLTENPPRLLRPGLVSVADIESVIGKIARTEPETSRASETPLLSPGLLRRHYAPNAPLILSETDGQSEVERLLAAGERVGWLTFDPNSITANAPNLFLRPMPHEPRGYAHLLFATLYELDALGVTRIVVAALPASDDWLAIADRLRRASAHE